MKITLYGTGKQHRLLRNHSNLFSKSLCPVFRNLQSIDLGFPLCHIIKPGNEIDQSCLAGTSSPDDTDRLSCFRSKRNILQRRLLTARIAKCHVFHLYFHGSRFRLCFLTLSIHKLGSECKYLIQTGCRCYCFCKGNNQIRQRHQRQKNLGHIIDQGDHLSLCQQPFIYLSAPIPDNRNNPGVDDNICHRIQQRRNPPGQKLQLHQYLTLCIKLFLLFLLCTKRTDHTDSRQIFSGRDKHLIQCFLHFFIQRDRHDHNTVDHKRQKRNCHDKDQCDLYIDRKCHNHCAYHNKRRSQKQTKHQIDAGLYLIDITCDPDNQRGAASLIHCSIRKLFNVAEQIMPKFCSETDSCFCRKILRQQGTQKSHYTKRHQQCRHLPDIRNILVLNSDINNSCSD